MTCPKCFGKDVSPIGDSHYVCNNPDCINNGARTQFRYIVDNKVKFPYNQIFVNRSNQDFFRKPYLVLESVGYNKV